MSSEALYERYKDALRTGHIAAVRGRLDAAVAAYGEAAALAPDRPLPHASLGRVLLKLERVDEALGAFGVALRCAPRDEGALTGRADALVAAGRQVEAAGVLDLLADTLEAADRIPDACDIARRAFELAESRARRRHLEALVGQLRGLVEERADELQLSRALRTLESPTTLPNTAPAVAPGSEDELAMSVDATVVEGAAGAPIEAPPPEESPFDANAVTMAVDAAVETGDPAVVHEVVLASASALRRAGLLAAAIDACMLGLTVAPADPDLHLALAELDLDHGWIEMAADKLAILARFVELTGDTLARERLCVVVGERFPDDPRLTAICA
jgi:tetratricopeptide (TPR) repeat protein